MTILMFISLLLCNDLLHCSVGIAKGYWMDDTGSIPGKGKRFFSIPYSLDRGMVSALASFRMGTGGFHPRLKPPGRQDDHSPASSAEIKNGGAIPPIPHTFSWRGA
jgi:hypothetical protein